MANYLEFEKHLADIEGKAEELRALARQNEGMDVEKEAAALDRKAATMLRDLYKSLTPWQRARSRATRSGPIAATTSSGSSPNTPPWPATATSPTTMP